MDGKLTCWTASEATYLLRKQLAAMLAMPEAGVRRVYVDGSGCYGRNATKMPLRTLRSWRAPRAGRSACNGCARTSTVGTRKVRRH